MRLSVQDILEATGGHLVAPHRADAAALTITGVSTDTRVLRPADLFVPLRGPRTDGHAFVAEAFRRGAVASLTAQRVEELPPDALLIRVADPLRALGQIAHRYRQTLPVAVVGITGSVGKTTTTKMTAATLAASFRVAQTEEDWNAEVGVPLALLGLTPAHQVAVVEMAMRGLGQIADLVAIAEPTIGVVTTIGETHLEFLGTRENIARAKGELIAGLPAHGTAVLNADDPLVTELAALCRGAVLTYGLDTPAEVSAREIRTEPTGVRFRLVAVGRSAEIALPVWGRHNVRNALAAAAVGVVMGMDLERVRDGLVRYTPPRMRLEPVAIGDILLLNDTYNASPASMVAAFDVVRELGRRRRCVAVLGGMKELGSHSVAMHQEVGRALAAGPVAVLITVGEEASQIADGAANAGMDRAVMRHAQTCAEAVEVLRTVLRAGDVVLVKGSRAMEMERIVEALQARSPAVAGGRPEP